MTYDRYISQIYCEYIHNYYVAVAWLLRCTCSNEGFSKVIILYKSRSYVEIYLLLPWTFGSFWLIYHYNFLEFIQLQNIYSLHHIRWIYARPILPKYDFWSVRRSTPFLSNLIFLYETGFYVDITFIRWHFLTIQQVVVKYFSKIFCIYILILVEKLLVEALKF